MDLLPTVAEIIDYEMPDNRPIDGASIMPFLEGDIDQRTNPIPFVHSKKMAWIDGDYKFRINVHGEASEAYNMITDRNETTNVIGSFSDSFLNDLKEEVITWNCSANWSYWGYDYLPPTIPLMKTKGLREVTQKMFLLHLYLRLERGIDYQYFPKSNYDTNHKWAIKKLRNQYL